MKKKQFKGYDLEFYFYHSMDRKEDDSNYGGAIFHKSDRKIHYLRIETEDKLLLLNLDSMKAITRKKK